MNFLIANTDKPVSVQLTSPKCSRCVPFSQAITKEVVRRAFHWAIVNVFENRDLVETFEITTQSAFVGYVAEVDQDF